ncbi:MAG: hypothetical protein K1X88_25765 [Nannocystaceae bacterium]|nr:hypothetical protein [Nannocystaceae bacterium]
MRWRRAGGLLMATALAVAAWPTAAQARETDPTFIDPRRRQLPATHRFRLGLELAYMRLSKAVDADSGKSQRFHYIPLMADFAYQAQFLKYVMVRPSLAMGTNVGNTLEAMPLVIHPQLHAGYQGALVGVAIGYGWFHPLINRKDVISASRGGLGEPVILNNHHIGGELSFTTRVDRGALSFILRGAGVRSHLQHFELDKRKSWRAMFTFNIGWYFGDGSKQRARQAQRRAERAAREQG